MLHRTSHSISSAERQGWDKYREEVPVPPRSVLEDPTFRRSTNRGTVSFHAATPPDPRFLSSPWIQRVRTSRAWEDPNDDWGILARSFGESTERGKGLEELWRRRRDSNHRYGFWPV